MLHICAINASDNCIKYLTQFKLLDFNEQDIYSKTPIYYFTHTHKEDTNKNRDLFKFILTQTNLNKLKKNFKYFKSLRTWQTKLINF